MKLRLIVDYDRDLDEDYAECAEDSAHPFSSRTGTRHKHETRSFESVLIYTVMYNHTRGSYDNWEYPLVDIPDDLVFQYMILGIQDGDFICYNYNTNRIVLANKSRLASRYARRVNDADEPHTWHGRNKGYSTDHVFDYTLEYDKPEPEENIYFDVKEMYKETLEVLVPWLDHKFIKEFTILGQYMIRNLPVIGVQTQMGVSSGYDEPTAISGSKRNIEKITLCPIPDEEIKFLFLQFIANGPQFVRVRDKLKNSHVEVFRQYTVDIATLCSEKTGTEWDLQ